MKRVWVMTQPDKGVVAVCVGRNKSRKTAKRFLSETLKVQDYEKALQGDDHVVYYDVSKPEDGRKTLLTLQRFEVT